MVHQLATDERRLRRGAGEAGGPTRRLLVPVDFSDCSRASLDRAASLAAAMNAAVDILHVWPHPVAAQRSRDAAAMLALARVALAMDDLRAAIVCPQVRSSRIRIAYGSAAESIIQVAGEGYDLVVMASHHPAQPRTPGGVVDRVAAGAPCPVLAVSGEGSSP